MWGLQRKFTREVPMKVSNLYTEVTFYKRFINMYVKRFSWFNIWRKLFQMEILIILINGHKIHEPARFHENRMFFPKFLSLKNEYVTESHLQSLGSQSAYRCYWKSTEYRILSLNQGLEYHQNQYNLWKPVCMWHNIKPLTEEVYACFGFVWRGIW